MVKRKEKNVKKEKRKTFGILVYCFYICRVNDKQKRKAVHDYQFVVYTPQMSRYKKTDILCAEIIGHTYPYRSKAFDVRWLSPWHKNRRWYWDPFYNSPRDK